ncbi:MAG: hypothetical protein RJA81_816 [Planctomycetota bacterium]
MRNKLLGRLFIRLFFCTYILAATATTWADRFVMKTGETYVGHYERDGVIMGCFDGVKRTLFRATRLESREEGAGLGSWESFKLIQPKKGTFISNQMPTVLVGVKSGPWDSFGRRTFQYRSPRSPEKTYDLTQALVEIGPKACKYRGIETYWTGQVATSEVPREVIKSLLNRIPKEEKEERLRVVRFYLQAQWFKEAEEAISGLKSDFPEMAENLDRALTGILDEKLSFKLDALKDLERRGWPLSEIKPEAENLVTLAKAAGQTSQTVSQEYLDLINATEDSRSRRQRELKAAFDGVRGGSNSAGPGPDHLSSMLEALEKCPTKVEPLFAAFDTYAKNPNGVDPKKAWALALSSWVAGSDLATDSIAKALAFAEVHDLIARSLHSGSETDRADAAQRLGSLLVSDENEAERPLKASEAAAIVKRVRPVNTLSDEAYGKPVTYRVENDSNAVPSEYVAVVPPGYHHLGQWPALIVLNPGGDKLQGLEVWQEEAMKRGYILIAPDLQQTGAYHFSSEEHATVTLCLRDALKRLAIDSNRVFVAGGLGGGDMAWDYATSHPDMLAGGVVLSGLPAKFVPAYRSNSEMIPLYIVEGELAPGETQLIQPMTKGLMQKNWDVTHVQYYKRGYEFFDEEIPTIFNWMSGRQRNPFPDEISAVAGRDGDQRFFGIVIQEFSAGRSMPPETVETLGENLRPAKLECRFLDKSNQIQINCEGVKALDVWVPASTFDFDRRFEVKLGGRSRFRGTPEKQWSVFLEDLVTRGDTNQTYLMKLELR